MRAKCFAVLIAFCMVIVHVSAQPYSIRANRGLNLRAAPSLNADIADTVPSGSILQVVGNFNRWLKIDRNGREVWLAGWVNFSRGDESTAASNPQPASAASANVDNCCFVDRQCSSDAEWEAGYWAYQNGQCAAPAQPQPVPPAQPGSSAPSTVDNCCHVDRQCSSDAEWINGFWAFQNNQCPSSTQSPAPELSRPRIEGSEIFARQINATLDLLQNTTTKWYDYIISGMDRIFEVPSLTGKPSSCIGNAHLPIKAASAHTGCTFIATTCWSQRMWWVGLLAHEACHIHTYEAGIDYAAMGLDEEIECGKIGYAASLAVNPAWTRSVVKRNLNATRVSFGQPIIVPTC